MTFLYLLQWCLRRKAPNSFVQSGQKVTIESNSHSISGSSSSDLEEDEVFLTGVGRLKNEFWSSSEESTLVISAGLASVGASLIGPEGSSAVEEVCFGSSITIVGVSSETVLTSLEL